MNQMPVKWVESGFLLDDATKLRYAGARQRGMIPVVELSALREVVEGLKRIAEPNQEPFATTTDAIRALSATLKMLNASRDEAQRLLTLLVEE